MTAPKLTRWFKCSEQQPTIPGWYDVKWHGDTKGEAERNKRLYFDGANWRGSLLGSGVDNFPDDAWRGLADKPEAV